MGRRMERWGDRDAAGVGKRKLSTTRQVRQGNCDENSKIFLPSIRYFLRLEAHCEDGKNCHGEERS